MEDYKFSIDKITLTGLSYLKNNQMTKIPGGQCQIQVEQQACCGMQRTPISRTQTVPCYDGTQAPYLPEQHLLILRHRLVLNDQ